MSRSLNVDHLKALMMSSIKGKIQHRSALHTKLLAQALLMPIWSCAIMASAVQAGS
jgi:hypothetical protein